MLNYFKESVKEFKHISWPTKAETKTYLKVVISVLVAYTIYLMVLGGFFSTLLLKLKDLV
jgi:preprotein translocase SecE subunit